jgi:hypothetical protein
MPWGKQRVQLRPPFQEQCRNVLEKFFAERREARGDQMSKVPLPVLAALGWYALLMLSGLVVGELAFFPWPHLFMMWVGWKSAGSFVLALLIGAAAIGLLGVLLRRAPAFRTRTPWKAILAGLALAAGALVLLLVGAWVTATLLGWPTSA